MVDRLLDSLVALTAAFTGACLLVMLLREPCRKLAGSAFTYWLWLLVPLAVVAALAPALPHPVAPVPPTPLHSFAAPLAAQPAAAPQVPSLTDTILATWRGLALYLLGAWGLGTAAFLCRIALMQRRFVDGLGRLTRDPGRPNVFYSEKAGVSPSVVGLLRSRIVLPANFADLYGHDEQTLIMAHERTHVRERHPTAGALGVLMVAVQWFNPLAYLALSLLRIDQELACDAAVVTAHPAARATYAKAMLKARIGVDMNPPLAYCWISRLSLPMKDRISLLKDRPPSAGRRVIAGAMLTLLVSASAATAYALAPHSEFGLNLRPAVPRAAPSAAPNPVTAPRAEAKLLSTKARALASPAPVSSSVPQSVVSVAPGAVGAVAANPADEVANPGLEDLDERSQRLYYALADAAARGENVAPPVIRWTTAPSGQTSAVVMMAPTSRDPLNFDDLKRVSASIG